MMALFLHALFQKIEKMRCVVSLIVCLLLSLAGGRLYAQNERYTIRGEVVDATTRRGIAYATVVVEEQPTLGGSADSLGRFVISGLKPGIYRFGAYSLGFEPSVSAEYIISSNSAPVEIKMEPSATAIDTLVVVRSLFAPVVQSPVSMRRIGLQQIEKSAGANRDLSKVVLSYPGVAFSPASNRNDLLVRGGSPSENRFYVDGFSLPNINHFSTQGASGGPVGLINADLVREIELYSGAFPLSTSGALSSVLDIELRNGNPEEQNFKATLGASEVGLSGSGHFSERSDYIFSVRRSYLQFLFQVLGLPFLPDYYDALFKVRTKLSANDELNFLVVGALDDMTLNGETTTETGQYLLSYLPEIEQQTLSAGVSYRHFSGRNSNELYLSYSYVGDGNLKYLDNDSSSDDNLLLDLRAREQQISLRNENTNYFDSFTLRYGAEVGYTNYGVDSYIKSYSTATGDIVNYYDANLGLIKWGAFAGGEYSHPNRRFTASAGLRFDGNNYSSKMSSFWRYVSPRASMSYALSDKFALNFGSGHYYQLPPLTALSYTEADELVNRDLSYIGVWETTLGVDYTPRRELKLSVEGFYKDYSNMLLSLESGIPLWDTGADYGSIGAEALSNDVDGRAYGVEIMARGEIAKRLSSIASLTIYKSEYRSSIESGYLPSAWDNGYIFNLNATYSLPRNWSVAAKFSAIGGAPYTPYDIALSSLVGEWDTNAQAQLDYSLHHSERLKGYYQLDLRVDKNYYFKNWGLGIYLDIQNITVSQIIKADIPLSTGEIEDSSLPYDQQRYVMNYIANESGVMLPTIGISIEF